MAWEQEAHDLIKATADRIANEQPFERSNDISAQIERAMMETACDHARRTGVHFDAVRIHPATLDCMRIEMEMGGRLTIGSDRPHGYYGPAGMIEIIEDDNVKPGTFEPEWRRFK